LTPHLSDTHAGRVLLPVDVFRNCPDVPAASHVGTALLDAISVAPLVGMLQAGIDDADENVRIAPLLPVGRDRRVVRPSVPA